MWQELGPWLLTILYLVNRWVHDIGTTLLIGGVLFLEYVVPIATADLHEPQRLAVFGRARWVFQKVVWWSAALLLVSGAISALRMWQTYQSDSQEQEGWRSGPTPWFCAHAALGVIGMLLAFRATAGRHLLKRPVGWLRLTLAILLICVFMAVVTRYVRLHAREWRGLPAPSHHEEV